MKQAAFNKLKEQVNDILFNEWDPIGVNSNPEVDDEYKSHAKKVSGMLRDSRDAFAITKYLGEIESGMLSLPENKIRLQKVVNLLLELRDNNIKKHAKL